MGNNHDKYFGKEKRNILVLGLPECGKTCKYFCSFSNDRINCRWQTCQSESAEN